MPVRIRPATMEDLPFIDGLQKVHTKQVGFMHTKALEGKIKLGHVLIAESGCNAGVPPVPAPDQNRPEACVTAERVGFVIGCDQYFKRDDCGIIYQLCVVPEMRRSLIGAMLVKAMFERAAYGCRLFCCWCAQDLEANRFWESLGFVPLAFRSGSRTRGKGGTPRVHIFWQKRIREGDTTTPWWFPSETKGGSIREDRIVLPIPPDTHWSEVKRVVLPGEQVQAPAPTPREARNARTRPAHPNPAPAGSRFGIKALWFTPPPPPKSPKPRPEKKPPLKNDPKLISAARELRDRYLEAVNADPSVLLPRAKYELARALPEPALPEPARQVKALPLAA